MDRSENIQSVYKKVQKSTERKWKTYDLTTGEEIDMPAHWACVNPGFNTGIVYGECDMGAFQYDAVEFLDGGGSVCLPFIVIEGEVWVGVLTQNRPLAGGNIKNCPRGFKKLDEEALETARRELSEELIGLESAEIIEMPGKKVNMNTAFSDTVNGGSISFTALNIPESAIEYKEGIPAFKDFIAVPKKSNAEKILSCELITIWEALELECGMTALNAGRLLAHLKKEGHLTLK